MRQLCSIQGLVLYWRLDKIIMVPWRPKIKKLWRRSAPSIPKPYNWSTPPHYLARITNSFPFPSPFHPDSLLVYIRLCWLVQSSMFPLELSKGTKPYYYYCYCCFYYYYYYTAIFWFCDQDKKPGGSGSVRAIWECWLGVQVMVA